VSVPLLAVDQGDVVDAIARRMLELLDERDAQPSGFVDAKTLARTFGVSTRTVYEHAAELGGVQLGEGDRRLIRFDVQKAREAWIPCDTSERSVTEIAPPVREPRRRTRPAAQPAGKLLPVRGSQS
jgi:hypothetical protein